MYSDSRVTQVHGSILRGVHAEDELHMVSNVCSDSPSQVVELVVGCR